MIGIQEIATYIPEKRITNYTKTGKFDITEEFIREKIGVERVAVKEISERSSDFCVKAYERLRQKVDLDIGDVDAIVVVTQNPDYNIPHTSAIVHGLLDAPTQCACFDISLGCSGFVYALSVIQSFMNSNNMRKGLLFTSDQYSRIIDADDKNTSLIFGDAACVTLVSREPTFKAVDFTFGTMGKSYRDLICEDDILYMNGRAIFNFACKVIPEDLRGLLKRNNLGLDDIDRYIFHQGSKFIVDTLTKRIGLPTEKVPYDMMDYGNAIASSIPIILEKRLRAPEDRRVIVSGFGLGLSWSTAILERVASNDAV